MTTPEITTLPPDTDAEGFLLDPQQWNERVAADIASAVISKGSLEGIYPGLIMANGARMLYEKSAGAQIIFT